MGASEASQRLAALSLTNGAPPVCNGGSTPAAAEACGSIAALPDQLLGRILALAGSAASLGNTVPLVCKRWRTVFYSEPRLWRALRFDGTALQRQEADAQEDCFPAVLTLLFRVCSHLVRLHLAGAHLIDHIGASTTGRWQVLDFLDQLDAGRLTELGLLYDPLAAAEAAPKRVLEALPRFSQLTCLELAAPWLPTLGTALGQLTQLRSLSLRTSSIPTDSGSCIDSRSGGALGGLLQLGQLTQLRLEAAAAGQGSLPAAVTQLTRLSLLRQLSLHHDGSVVLDLPAPADFPNLQAFSFGMRCVRVAGVAFDSCDYSAADGDDDDGKVDNSSNSSSGAPPADQRASPCQAGTLELRGAAPGTSLRPLLQALLPPGHQTACVHLDGNKQ